MKKQCKTRPPNPCLPPKLRHRPSAFRASSNSSNSWAWTRFWLLWAQDEVRCNTVTFTNTLHSSRHPFSPTKIAQEPQLQGTSRSLQLSQTHQEFLPYSRRTSNSLKQVVLASVPRQDFKWSTMNQHYEPAIIVLTKLFIIVTGGPCNKDTISGWIVAL